MQIVAENIKRIVRLKGFKQKSVAERAGFNEKVFSDMLNGRKCIKAEHIPLIAVALGVTPNDLFSVNPKSPKIPPS